MIKLIASKDKKGMFYMISIPTPKLKRQHDPSLDANGWPKRWSDPTYLGGGPWGP